LQAFSPPPAIFFGGFGEPLSHPDIADMVAEAKKLKSPVELISNAMLLSAELAKRLTAARLDVLWVSLEGAKAESYSDVRLGGELSDALDNIRQFRDSRQAYHTEIGVVFVAMKRNIAELPEVMHLARELGATRFLVTNVLPYTKDLREEALYSSEPADSGFTSPAVNTSFELCKMDINDATRASLHKIIRNGSTAIRWDGSVSPCLPLMHNHTSYLGERKRFTRHLIAGNVTDKNLSAIWDAPEYLNIRRRVQAFYFASCTACKGCELAEENETDCLGSGFPACGGCLWAQGFIRCP
jgi:MoaA/NifB/PqqE/SkfB family radical SAM enzyme